MSTHPLQNQRIIIREDFNVPLQNGKITSDARIRAALPTIEAAIKANARVILLSHLGRPEEGHYDPEFSLAPVAARLSELLKKPVRFVKDWLQGIDIAPAEVVLCENVRFNKGEKKNDEALSRQMASLCDVFMMDAFATAHRAEASTYGIAQFAPIACAGPLLMAELNALRCVLENPKRPLLAIVGGSKVSTKLTMLAELSKRVDQLIVGGGIANTFIAAAGFNIGRSLCEPELIEEAKRLIASTTIPIPQDVIVAKTFSSSAKAEIKSIKAIADDDMILDIGPETAKQFVSMIKKANTILWNGPVGVFEFEAFSQGTRAVAMAIAESSAFSIAGGGDTIAAIDRYGIADKLSYISTGGGAFLEFLEGKKLPAVAILEERGKELS